MTGECIGLASLYKRLPPTPLGYAMLFSKYIALIGRKPVDLMRPGEANICQWTKSLLVHAIISSYYQNQYWLEINVERHMTMQFELWYRNDHSRKSISNCCLKNVGYFILDWMCYVYFTCLIFNLAQPPIYISRHAMACNPWRIFRITLMQGKYSMLDMPLHSIK